jgi:hypothetical protein
VNRLVQHINFAALERCPQIPMKPLSPTTRQRRSHLSHPDLDAQYHATHANFRATGDRLKPSPTLPSPAPSFRELSRKFLGAEMKRDYAFEAAFFAIIVAVSAWPIISTLQALTGLVK